MGEHTRQRYGGGGAARGGIGKSDDILSAQFGVGLALVAIKRKILRTSGLADNQKQELFLRCCGGGNRLWVENRKFAVSVKLKFVVFIDRIYIIQGVYQFANLAIVAPKGNVFFIGERSKAGNNQYAYYDLLEAMPNIADKGGINYTSAD